MFLFFVTDLTNNLAIDLVNDNHWFNNSLIIELDSTINNYFN